MSGNAILFILALSLAGEPGAAPPSSGQSNERICRGGGQRSLGSHIRTRRRCLTAEQWRQEDEARSQPVPSLRVTEGQNDGRTAATPR